MLERGLGLVGAPNTRDLGGIVTVDGRRLRSGVLMRASALGRLTDGDVAVLAERKLAHVVDLRDTSEIETAPPDRLPTDPAPRVRHIPVFDPEHPVFTYVSAVLMGHDVAATPVAGVDGSPGAMVELYRWMVGDEGATAGFAVAIRAVADAAGEPLLFHCSAGKDRTGWLAAVLLSIVGVDRDTITADYLATNGYSRATHVAIMDAMRAKGRLVQPEVLLPLFEVRPEYLAAAYGEVEQRYGGMERYVRDALGVDADTADALRDLLLDRP
ncbi:tyrosine-protein phosphatase [Planosporangium flavigriseum]|uniref:Protein-tyrosine-phosphatase n=1 Tax=Planosporangium flavigriseum TaxID=373681 RepID=A0A8J3LL33_9ACTN|nr:tyrosine-protein phosphatase [Planosporangium flavigriseum]NJC65297.1 tyrosine-protein phosphatase [Planosporangium flavigriseum]GIG73349.1 protein-tyrosine-phosphatase [Planosporangium flavigriseum]